MRDLRSRLPLVVGSRTGSCLFVGEDIAGIRLAGRHLDIRRRLLRSVHESLGDHVSDRITPPISVGRARLRFVSLAPLALWVGFGRTV